MSLQRVPINNFRGGLNTRDGVFDLQPNESPDLLNITISALVGQLETRKGTTRLDTGGMPAQAPDNAKQVVLGAAGKRFLMLSINGGVYALAPNGEVKKLFAGAAGTIWDFEVFSDAAFKDWVYMGNGQNKMQKWDGEAAATVEWKATKGAIPEGGVVRVWENRMFITYVGANPQRIYFSEFGDPEATVNEYGFVDVRGSEEDLDAIQDLHPLGARLIVLKRRGVFFISSSVTMVNRHIGGPGVWGRFMTAELESKLYFFNPQGIFSTGGVEVTMESGSINNYFPANLNKEQLEKARLIATKDTYPRLIVAIATGASTSNDKVIEMVPHINFRRIGGRRYLLLPAFMLHSIPATALACWNPTGTEETIVGGKLVPAGTEFAEAPPTLDTFNRAAEDPLSNGGKWTKWAWARAIGKIIKSTEGFWTAKEKGAVATEGARWNVGEFSRPLVFLGKTDKTTICKSLCLNACFALAAQTGYTGRFTPTAAGANCNLKIEKWNAGVKTVLAETNIGLNIFRCSFAMTVAENKIRLWIKRPESFGWIEWLNVEDASFNKGYSGFEMEGQEEPGNETLLQNFGSEALPITIGRVYTMFSGVTDEGVQISAHWKSAWLPVQEQEPKERIRRINVELSGDAIIDVFKDFEAVATFTATLPREGERKEYGEPAVTEEEGLQYRFTRVRPETRGRFHQIQFRTDPEGRAFKINSAELAVRGGKEH